MIDPNARDPETGKTPAEEARDSATMLVYTIIGCVVFYGGLAVWFFCG